MPFRSPKMYSFIFGFQRLVWWPKCTPASSRSFIAIPANSPPFKVRLKPDTPLAFTELEAFPRSRHAVLLAFLGPRVARQQPFVLQLLAQLEVVFDQRARDAESHGACLPRDPAAGHGRQNIELVGGFREHERLANLGTERFGGEERVEGFVVDVDGPCTGPEKNAGGRCLASSGSVILHCCHVTRPHARELLPVS